MLLRKLIAIPRGFGVAEVGCLATVYCEPNAPIGVMGVSVMGGVERDPALHRRSKARLDGLLQL
jgi:hypothetical protein